MTQQMQNMISAPTALPSQAPDCSAQPVMVIRAILTLMGSRWVRPCAESTPHSRHHCNRLELRTQTRTIRSALHIEILLALTRGARMGNRNMAMGEIVRNQHGSGRRHGQGNEQFPHRILSEKVK